MLDFFRLIILRTNQIIKWFTATVKVTLVFDRALFLFMTQYGCENLDFAHLSLFIIVFQGEIVIPKLLFIIGLHYCWFFGLKIFLIPLHFLFDIRQNLAENYFFLLGFILPKFLQSFQIVLFLFFRNLLFLHLKNLGV